MAIVKTNQKQLYAQVAGSNVSNILKLKENYPNLLTKKIENIQKIINDLGKLKPCIKMTTKGPPQKYIIVSMGKDNISKFIVRLDKPNRLSDHATVHTMRDGSAAIESSDIVLPKIIVLNM